MPCAPSRDFPATLMAGATWSWTVELDVSVPVGSTLVYTFRAADRPPFGVTGVRAPDGLSFVFVAVPSDTGKLARGKYAFVALLTANGTTAPVRMGTLNVLPNLADPSAETRTQNEIDLADVEKTLRGISKRENGSFSTGDGVSYTVQQIEALERRRDRLKQRVDAEQGRGGATTIRTVFGCGSGLPSLYRR